MKFKQTLLFILLCITFFTCSTESVDPNEEGEEETTDNTLLKKLVETYDGETFTTTLTYDGKKLTNIKDSDGYETKIIYTDDKITQIDNLVEGEIMEYFTLIYDNEGMILSYKQYLYDIDDKNIAYNHILTYNNDNTVDVEVLSGDFTSQTNSIGVTTYTIVNSNIIKIKFDDIIDNYSYEYDDKKGILKNVLGFEAFNFINYYNEYGFEIYAGNNNLIKLTDVQEGWPTDIETFEYLYNDNGYPLTAVTYYNGELDGTIEYFYE